MSRISRTELPRVGGTISYENRHCLFLALARCSVTYMLKPNPPAPFPKEEGGGRWIDSASQAADEDVCRAQDGEIATVRCGEPRNDDEVETTPLKGGERPTQKKKITSFGFLSRKGRLKGGMGTEKLL